MRVCLQCVSKSRTRCDEIVKYYKLFIAEDDGDSRDG
jgi:hypothetical protein